MGELEPSIPRKSPEFEVELGSVTLKLTYMNTIFYDYHEPYQFMAHIITEDPEDEDTPWVILDNEPVNEVMRDFHYPTCILPFPTEDDVEMYVQNAIQELEHGL